MLNNENEQVIESVRQLLNHPGWKILEAGIEANVERLTSQLVDPSKDRKDKMSDEFLRAGIQWLRHVQRMGKDLVEQHDENMERKNAEKEAARMYDDRAESGHFGPI